MFVSAVWSLERRGQELRVTVVRAHVERLLVHLSGLRLVTLFLVYLAEPGKRFGLAPRGLAGRRRVGCEQLDRALQVFLGNVQPAAVFGRREDRPLAAQQP